MSVEQITRAAGVARGTFYTYFETKSDIIVEEFWKIDRYYQKYASRNPGRYKSPANKLRGGGDLVKEALKYCGKCLLPALYYSGS
ncbi:MAG: TetR/AcrR family transcriptional regulator [Spirochaetaceae bacterium]|nr:TetR/AcrR family transcriptional regulator [Spirochaetaceae bacterium]